jgi:hypothetical protein
VDGALGFNTGGEIEQNDPSFLVRTLFAIRPLRNENSRIRKVKDAGPGSYIVIIPRYQEFTTVAEWLAGRDIHFVEIAQR